MEQMMERVYIIAEAGVNHNGDIRLAKKLIDMAVECGADAVKFQTFKAEECTTAMAPQAQYQLENTQTTDNQLEMIRKLELPFQAFSELKEYCGDKNIDFISTPDGEESLQCLIDIDVPLIKIGSTEVTNQRFLRQIGETMKPIILSTGMSNLGEVEQALEVLYSTNNKNITLMHCVTDYPTQLEDLNLRAMVTLKDAFKIPVGLSDHTEGVEGAIAAVALGAGVIEKHITLDREMEGPDHKASMDLVAFRDYVTAIRNTEKLLGDGIKKPTKREISIMQDVRRSIVAGQKIQKNTVIEECMLAYKRPGTGIEPKLTPILIGKRVSRTIEQDELISWDDLL